MKRFLIPALAAASLVAAVSPALAQPYGHQGPRHDGYNVGPGAGGLVNERQDRIERRIDQGVRTGQVTRREAIQLRAELNRIEGLERYYRRSDGLSGWERRDLERRLDSLSARVFAERNDQEHRRYR